MTRPPPATMKAAVWSGGDAGLHIETVPTPVPAAGEVLVEVAACGVCHTDLHVMRGEVAFPAPAVLGHEISGVVIASGPGVEHLPGGTRVVGAFIMPCGSCRQCERGRDDLCVTFFTENRLKGNLLDGTSRLTRADGTRLSMYSMAGLAEYAVVPASAVTPLPTDLPLLESCVLGCAAFTAHGAMKAAGLRAGQSLAVVAVGGIGSSLLQLGRHLGAVPLIAIDVSDDKLENARALGAEFTINSRTQDAAVECRAILPDGVDVVIEALGRPETVELAHSLLADGGTLVVVGIAAGTAAASIPITSLVRRGHTIKGSFGARTREDLPEVVRLAAENAFEVRKAVSRIYPLQDAALAYDDLKNGRITGRAIVQMPRAAAQTNTDERHDDHD